MIKISYNLTVKLGDIIKQKADYTLNPSNTKMLLGSGVSMAFYRNCGGVVLQE